MTVKVTKSGGVCRITLDRPDKLNALNEAIRRRLSETFAELADDVATRVVVLAGEGRAFSAGFDLGEPPDLPDDWAGARHAAGAWQRLLDDLEAIPQVSVASLQGPVVGGAFLLAACCDLRVAATDARFSIPEVALGIPLTWAGLPRLVREVGLPRTRDLVMTGRTVTAEDAHAWGLVQRLVERPDLGTATDRLVEALLRMPAAPLMMTRSALRAVGRSALPMGWADADLLTAALDRPESREAAAEYLRRRFGGQQFGEQQFGEDQSGG